MSKPMGEYTLNEIKGVCDKHYKKGTYCDDNGCPFVGICHLLFMDIIPSERWVESAMREWRGKANE